MATENDRTTPVFLLLLNYYDLDYSFAPRVRNPLLLILNNSSYVPILIRFRSISFIIMCSFFSYLVFLTSSSRRCRNLPFSEISDPMDKSSERRKIMLGLVHLDVEYSAQPAAIGASPK